MHRSTFSACFRALALLFSCQILPSAAGVDGLFPEDAAISRVRHGGAIQPLGDNPFGEIFHAKTGQLDLRQVDVLLKGTGPDIEIARSFTGAGKVDSGSEGRGPFADWDLDIPRITTLVPSDRNNPKRGLRRDTGSHGQWRVAGAKPSAVCSAFAKPVPAPVHTHEVRPWELEAEDWWDGAQVRVSGKVGELLLNLVPRTAFGQPVKLVTKDGWAITCLAKTANGEPGEAFLAISPEGTRYWMDWLEFQMAPTAVMPPRSDAYTSEAGATLERDVAMYMPSKIQDKFGNTLTFNYAAHRLVGIEASDGRKVEIKWGDATAVVIDARAKTGLIEQVSVVGRDGARRSWKYAYQVVSRPATAFRKGMMFNKYYLTSVVLPDNRAWNFTLYPIQNVNYRNSGFGNCDYGFGDFPTGLTTTIKHPSGLSANFTYERTWFVRAKQPAEHCVWMKTDEYGEYTDYMPNPYWLLSLTSKTISGPGLAAAQTTRYTYVGAASLRRDSSEKAATPLVSTDITYPGGEVDRYSYVNTWGISEGDLVSIERRAVANGPVLSKEVWTHATGKEGPFAERAGVYPMPWTFANTAQIETNRPTKAKELQQYGQTYVWRVDAFNDLAFPASTSRFNSVTGTHATLTPANSLRETFAYYKDPARWIMGMPLSTTNTDTGEVISKNVVDPANGMVKERHAFGLLKATYGWDAKGNLASVKDGQGNTTIFADYVLGVPQTITFADKTVSKVTVDGFGQIVAETDQVGATRAFTYNAAGWLLSETQPAADSVAWLPTRYSYDYPNGQLRATRTTGGLVETTLYDALLRPLSNSRSAAGQTITNTTRYDWKGRVVFTSYPGQATGVSTTYDALGQITRVEQDSELGKLSTLTRYLPDTRKEVTDPRGTIVVSRYQAFDVPDYQAALDVTWPGVRQVIVRDAYGNPLSITQSGQFDGKAISTFREFQYDAYKRLCRYQDPESGATISEYDKAGNVRAVSLGQPRGSGCLSALADSAKVINKYDAMSRLVSVVYPDGSAPASFTYDLVGNLKTAASDGSTWAYTRNKRGLLNSEVLTLNNRAYALKYAYDANGSLSWVSYPNGQRVDYQPDAMGRATRAGGVASKVTYFPDGQIQSFDYGNGLKYMAKQNARQLLSKIAYQGTPSVLYDATYTYDKSANLVAAVDGVAGGKRGRVMQYDEIGRLVRASQAGIWGSETYQYDPLNNLRRVDQGTTSRKFDYSAANTLTATQLNGKPERGLVYDARGNVVSLGGNTLKFNAANQLTWYAGLESYRYDGLGNRFARLDIPHSAQTYYGYSSAGKLMFEVDGNTGKSSNYIYVNKILVAKDAE